MAALVAAPVAGLASPALAASPAPSAAGGPPGSAAGGPSRSVTESRLLRVQRQVNDNPAPVIPAVKQPLPRQ